MKVATKKNIWQQLLQEKELLRNIHLRDLLSFHQKNIEQFSLSLPGIFVDFSKNHITEEIIQLLCQLAETCQLPDKIEALFTGDSVNMAEQTPALHTQCRDIFHLSSTNISLLSSPAFYQIQAISESLRNHIFFGSASKPIKDVVIIGMGGSYLGSKLVCHALMNYLPPNNLALHFVADLDGHLINSLIKSLKRETTLVVIVSKSFTTIETLNIASHFLKWFNDAAIIKNNVLAITAQKEKALIYGIDEKNILLFSNAMTGRYSLWSAVGLPIAIQCGMENFVALLEGANFMDQHFRTTPFRQNIPVMLALLSIWNINFWNTKCFAIRPYEPLLQFLPSYLQQLSMESNGKHVDVFGNVVNYATAPMIMGDAGCGAQHAYHQAILQGTESIPVDFILSRTCAHRKPDLHQLLIASCLAQAHIMAMGNDHKPAANRLSYLQNSANHIPGNIPSNLLIIEKIDPFHLGMLLALYEHKTYVESVIWNVNPFDQLGVEHGKQLTQQIYHSLANNNEVSELDPSTDYLLRLFKEAPK
jgi:glucose-6-phosphate isomerase